MSNIRSDVFEAYTKIAQEQGLISEDKPAEHTEKSFHETNPRHDSLSIEQIGKLYNTKPPSPKEMTYKRNIIEEAHPDTLVISPSYDKLNGLIENENQGQDIRIHISLKEPDGHLTQRKYAEKQLLLSLVRVGNELDNDDQEELAKIADVCLSQAAGRRFRKVAFWPVVIGIAACVAALYAKQHMAFHSDGFSADYQKATAEIDDLLNSNTNWGVGYQYTPGFLQMMNKLKTELAALNTEVQKITPILDKLQTPRTGKELAALAQQPDTQEVTQALQEFQNTFDEVNPYIMGVIADFGNKQFKQRAIAQKGWMSSMTDATEVLHGGAGLIADDFDDVKHALQTLGKDIANIATGLKTSQSVKQTVTQQLQNTQEESQKTFEPEAEAAPGATPEAKQDSGLGAMEEAVKGFLPGS
jgi:hypothetical protein